MQIFIYKAFYKIVKYIFHLLKSPKISFSPKIKMIWTKSETQLSNFSKIQNFLLKMKLIFKNELAHANIHI